MRIWTKDKSNWLDISPEELARQMTTEEIIALSSFYKEQLQPPNCSCEKPHIYKGMIHCGCCGKPIPVPRECQDHSYVCGLDIPKGNTKPEPLKKIEKLSMVYKREDNELFDLYLGHIIDKCDELTDAINKLNGRWEWKI